MSIESLATRTSGRLPVTFVGIAPLMIVWPMMKQASGCPAAVQPAGAATHGAFGVRQRRGWCRSPSAGSRNRWAYCQHRPGTRRPRSTPARREAHPAAGPRRSPAWCRRSASAHRGVWSRLETTSDEQHARDHRRSHRCILMDFAYVPRVMLPTARASTVDLRSSAPARWATASRMSPPWRREVRLYDALAGRRAAGIDGSARTSTRASSSARSRPPIARRRARAAVARSTTSAPRAPAPTA